MYESFVIEEGAEIQPKTQKTYFIAENTSNLRKYMDIHFSM